ncbi:hypothetical protein [Micromonospora sp. NPDC002575]
MTGRIALLQPDVGPLGESFPLRACRAATDADAHRLFEVFEELLEERG